MSPRVTWGMMGGLTPRTEHGVADDQTSSTPAKKAPVKRARTAAQQRAAAATPEELADGIAATRDDLAETLDAIADKVAPKKVAKRTAKKAVATTKAKATEAVEAVQEKVVEPVVETAKKAVPEKSWSPPTTTVPDPVPGVPITKAHVAAVGAVLAGLLVLRRRRRKR